MTRMRLLRKRLKRIGIHSDWIKLALPTWWNDSMAINPAMYAEALSDISNTFNLSIQDLYNDRKVFLSQRYQHNIKISK